MVASFPSQIERRPMTSKQARKRWQANGCPTISTTERRRIQREAELDRRAQKIRDDEKRKKDNAKRRKEKEQHDRDVKKRMGFQEEIKLPEGQRSLGQFFTKRTTRATAKAAIVQQETSTDQFEEANAQSKQDISKEALDSNCDDEHEAEEDLARCDKDTNTGHETPPVQKLAQEQLSDNELPSAVPMLEERKHWFTTPEKPKKATKLEDEPNMLQSKEELLTSHKLSRNSRRYTDTEIAAPSQCQLSQPLAHRPISLSFHLDPEHEQQAKQVESASLAITERPETRTSSQRSTSLPSILLKRDLQQAGFDQLNSYDDDGIIAAAATVNKRPRTSSFGSLATESFSFGEAVAASPTPLAVVSISGNFDQGIVQHVTTGLDDATSARSAEIHPQDSLQIPTESFNSGWLDEDLAVLLDAGCSQSVMQVTNSQASLQTKGSVQSIQRPDDISSYDPDTREVSSHIMSSASNKKTPKSKNSSPRKGKFGRTQSAQSYMCDFSSQDYAELEEMIKIPQQADKTNSTPPAPKIQLQISPSTSVRSSHNDSFELPGCTQALAALVDPDVQESRTPSPKVLRKPRYNIKTNTTMLPPPLPPLQPLTSHATNRHHSAQSSESEDIYNCFAGSTQALLDL